MSDQDFEEQIQQEEFAKRKEEGQQTYTDKDGTVFEWDLEKKAWFPKIDDDFIAKYQMNYGINNTTTETADGENESSPTPPADSDPEAIKKYEQYCKDYYSYYGYTYNSETQEGENSATGEESAENPPSNINPETGKEFKDYAEYYAYYYGEEYAEYYKNFQDGDVSVPGTNQPPKKINKKELKKLKAGEKRKPPPDKEEPAWFDHQTEESCHVYVSGLPTDTTDEEFQELMAKYGLIMFDPFTKKPKTKLYKDSEGNVKGDGLCCYIKKESVDLCLKLLDGLDMRGTGSTVRVEKAKFEMKGSFDPAKKKKKLSNKQKRKMRENQEKLFEWKLEKPLDVRLKHEKVVILTNMFDPKEFEQDPSLINELREDVRTECIKYGDVRKVTLFDRHPEGVMSVMYKTPEEADVCIAALNGRWFAKKQILAETWDGKNKYEIQETEEQKAERLKIWDKFLAEDDPEKKVGDGVEKVMVNVEVGSGSSTSESNVAEKESDVTNLSETTSAVENKELNNTEESSVNSNASNQISMETNS
ncbi:HIV Tat-specific factor 1 [Patella vulgata]|uniref:HIV Tat-specific factor 1 n=1 Tax=Patella vulgata TaxID=6465 RepID=UPI0024A90B08|nr:HIV Tat-specific factor 1 [Patella vulgata]XP_050392151.2 HIV Tat-specific factor 1 [Patella vulgata]